MKEQLENKDLEISRKDKLIEDLMAQIAELKTENSQISDTQCGPALSVAENISSLEIV